MEREYVVVYVEDYDLGTRLVVGMDTPLMEVYRSVMDKLGISIPKGKAPLFRCRGNWCYALKKNVGDLVKELRFDDLFVVLHWDDD